MNKAEINPDSAYGQPRVFPGAGFTLVEMLVVIFIIVILMTLLSPALSRVREKALQTACLAQMRDIGSAAMAWASDHNGTMEGGYSTTTGGSGGRRGWYYYLANPDNSYLSANGFGDRSLRCTKNEDGWYGMYTADVSRGCKNNKTPDVSWIFETDRGWPLDPGYVGGNRTYYKINQIPRPANTLFLTCTSRGNNPNQVKTGVWFFNANGPWGFNTTREGCSMWFAHSDEGGNGVYFDGHAQFNDVETLLNVENHPPCNDVKGIRVWKLRDLTKVEDGQEID